MTRRRMGLGVIVLLCWGWVITIAEDRVSAQTINFVPVGSIPGPAQLVKAQDRLVYIAADKTLAVFDISDPATPMRLGAYTFPLRIWGFRVVGSLVYVAADVFGLGVLDISDAHGPTLRGSLKTRGQAKNVAVSGTTALVIDMVSGLDIVDVSNPSKPVHVESVFLEGYPTDVVTSGSLAYAADRPTGFYVLDLTKPRPLEPTSVLQSATPSPQVEVLKTSAQGQTIAVLTGGLLQLFDVSNPTAPVKIPPYRTPGGAQRVSLKGTLAYVADDKAGLQVVDLSSPSTPRIVGVYQTAGPARDVAVADSLILVVVGSGDVLILRQTQ